MRIHRISIYGLTLALLAAWLGSPVIVAEDKEKEKTEEKLWTVDFEKAKAAAAKEGKDILMEFTGSDWCPPCKALMKNVFAKEAFQKEAPKHFILLKLDYPNDKSKQTEAEIKQNKKLGEEYKISGYPTILLVDAGGKPYAKMVGYSGDKAEAYTKGLVEKTALRKERDKFFAEAKAAQGVAKAKLLAKAIEKIDTDLALSIYRDTVDEIVKLDAKNEAGLKDKWEGRLKLSVVKEQLGAIRAGVRRDGVEASLKKVEKLIKDQKLTGEPLQEALFIKAVIEFQDDKDAAEKTLKQAVDAAPETEKAEEIKRILARVFGGSKEKKE